MSNPTPDIFRVLVVVILVVAGVSLFTAPAPAQAQITMQVFVNPHPVVSGGTIGFTFAGDKFVGSVQNDGAGVLYETDLQGQNVKEFGPNVNIPAGSYFSEHPVAASLGLGGFPQWDIYVGAGNNIVHISHDGARWDLFAKNLPGSVQSIRFDAVGTFKFEMLVGTVSGSICHISRTGIANCPISSLELMEGMDIVPLGAGFGGFDGQLITVAEASGLVRAISPSWQVTILNPTHPIPRAESVNFVPLDLGASGSAVEGMYEANYPMNIVKADGASFSHFRGDAIIAGEQDLVVWRMHWAGTGFEITGIGNTPQQGEDAIFVTPSMLNRRVRACKADDGRDE